MRRPGLYRRRHTVGGITNPWQRARAHNRHTTYRPYGLVRR